MSQGVENFLHAPVFSAENVPLSYAAFFFCQQMSASYVFYSHYIQPGVDVSRHASFDEIADHLSNWCRPDIPCAYRRGGIDNYHWKPRDGKLKRNLLGDEFRSFVMADHVIQGDWTVLVGGLAIVARPYCADRAGVHNLFHAGLTTG